MIKLMYKIGDVDYFEFNNHEYYALIPVKKLKRSEDSFIKSHKLYYKYVGGESLTAVKVEGSPTHLNQEDALTKCLKADGNRDMTVREIMDDFYKAVDVPVLVDGSLI